MGKLQYKLITRIARRLPDVMLSLSRVPGACMRDVQERCPHIWALTVQYATRARAEC